MQPMLALGPGGLQWAERRVRHPLARQTVKLLPRVLFVLAFGAVRALVLAIAFLVMAPAPAVAQSPVLGSRDFAPIGTGWGTVAPKKIHNGGAPSGGMHNITWKGWGAAIAYGRGTGAIYRPGGGYFPPVRMRLRARRLGTCPGHTERAYTLLEVRSPPWPGGPLGPWVTWSRWGICNQRETGRKVPLRGLCADIGRYADHGTAQQVEAYRVRCSRARQIVKRVIARERPAHCLDRGCAYRIGAFTCRLDRLHSYDAVGLDGERPVQRLACLRWGDASITAFLVI